jgi:hypothetical protein
VDVQVAGRGEDAQAVARDRVPVRAAGDEGDVPAGGGELGAEVAADPTGTHDRDPHGRLQN